MNPVLSYSGIRHSAKQPCLCTMCRLQCFSLVVLAALAQARPKINAIFQPAGYIPRGYEDYYVSFKRKLEMSCKLHR